MLARKLSNPPLIAILLVTLIFLLWSINWSNLASSTASMIPKSAGQRHNRIAIVTFITDQKSYIHLSLRNKDRKSDQIFGFIQELCSTSVLTMRHRLHQAARIRLVRRLRVPRRAWHYMAEI